jgi:murein DD-endopeptidase MepM/ murein hydrolase activator NlpD
MSSKFPYRILTFCIPLVAAASVPDLLHPQTGRFTWPVEKGRPPELAMISSTFGESRTDHFHAGVDIAGDKEEVRPVAGGKLLYYQFQSMNPYRPMSGAGNMIWIDHGEGRWSGYYHLSQFRMTKRYVERNNVIALSGNTGRSGGPHLHFFITENYGRTYVNPMIELLPRAEEKNPPVIEHLVFITDRGISRLKPGKEENNRIRLTRPYPIYLELRDPGLEAGSRRSPRMVEWKIENDAGTAGGSIDFQRIDFSRGALRLNGELEFEAVYKDSFLRLGEPEIANGLNRLTVRAVDYAGNESTTEFIMDVRREY